MRDNKANVYNGKKFVIEDKIESLKKLIESKKEFLETFINQIEGLMEIDKEVAIEIMNLFDKKDYEYDTERTINKTKELAYNSRGKIDIVKTEMDKRNKENNKIELGVN
jgi:superfamily II DNA or RNA helicase